MLIETYYRLKSSRYSGLLDFGLFAVITVFLHFFYWNFLGFFRETRFFEVVSGFMAGQVYVGAMWVNTLLLNVNITADYVTNTLYINGNDYITVNEGCSGFKQDYQLLGLFLLYPGAWKHKLWYIPFSFLVMHLTNIFRIVVLTVILDRMPMHWDFWHEWIMRPFYYVVIFALWVLWNEKFNKPSLQQNHQATAQQFAVKP